MNIKGLITLFVSVLLVPMPAFCDDLYLDELNAITLQVGIDHCNEQNKKVTMIKAL